MDFVSSEMLEIKNKSFCQGQMESIDYKNSSYNSSLSDSEMEQLYSKVDILYFLIDLNAIICSCNSISTEVLGYEKEELLGKNFLDFVRFEDTETVQNQIALCLKRGYIRSLQTALVCKSR